MGHMEALRSLAFRFFPFPLHLKVTDLFSNLAPLMFKFNTPPAEAYFTGSEWVPINQKSLLTQNNVLGPGTETSRF
jgi:hypothetical protein